MMILATTVLALVTAAPLPDGNVFVQGLAEKQRAREALLDQYTYDSFNVKEDLDDKGGVKERHTRVYEVFYVQGRPVRRLVAEDGKRLEGKDRTRDDERVTGQIAKSARRHPPRTTAR